MRFIDVLKRALTIAQMILYIAVIVLIINDLKKEE